MAKYLIGIIITLILLILITVIIDRFQPINTLRFVLWNKGYNVMNEDALLSFIDDPRRRAKLTGMNIDHVDKVISLVRCEEANEFQKNDCLLLRKQCQQWKSPSWREMCRLYNQGRGLRWLGSSDYYLLINNKTIIRINKTKP